jgi:hypothetical protein
MKLVPVCEVSGCNKFAQNTRATAFPRWRKAVWVREKYGVIDGYVCSACHNKNIAKKHGVDSIHMVLANNAGFDNTADYNLSIAIRAGFDNIADFVNSTHPYRKFRKDYCENKDSRLGYQCTSTIVWQGQLDVDHINGNPSDNREVNLQTLCKCCHSYKTHKEKDYATEGRKALGITY